MVEVPFSQERQDLLGRGDGGEPQGTGREVPLVGSVPVTDAPTALDGTGTETRHDVRVSPS